LRGLKENVIIGRLLPIGETLRGKDELRALPQEE